MVTNMILLVLIDYDDKKNHTIHLPRLDGLC